ncbi:hypothetical protein Goshw_020071 [Gossypium schwendimanii]|uniref:Transposase MuDR plant domain-containing protein n=1 Tax=Gossypium schwendimanii TaxID=34291 RepID=A0A7J9LH38_GOSSC|nr:hypothetical protein [Gossypium schwendimanii]
MHHMNDYVGALERVVLGATEGTNDGDGKGVGQGAFEVAGERGGDEEFQVARDKLKSFRGKSKPQEAHDEGIREANGHEIDYYESDDHGSIVEFSSKDEHEHGARRRRKFPVYNPNHENPKLCLKMLFRDGKDFKDAIRNYLKVSRRELKIVTQMNVSVKFSRTKKVNVAIIACHFEATIRNHPKMKLKETQQRVASEFQVNVTLSDVEGQKMSEPEDGKKLETE